MNAGELAEALRAAVREQRFDETPDAMLGGAALTHPPSIDLAVAAFMPGRAPVWANVLFSREHPHGLVADIPADAGPVRNVHFLADQTDAQLNSIAWRPHSDWSRLSWRSLGGAGAPQRFVAPYPASLLKLMVAVGVARLVDAGAVVWDEALSYQGEVREVRDWGLDMIAQSSNQATSALVSLLHAWGAIRRDAGGEVHNELHQLFEAQGLPTLRLANTRADGGWGNGAGSGVGQIQMTAWDTLRLLWLLDEQAPPAPWLPPGVPPLLSAASRARLRGWLDAQGLHTLLSSGLLAGLPGWVPGLDARLPACWLQTDGTARVAGETYPGDLRALATRATLRFAHKTGTTENYASDAGIVQGIAPARRHYLIALLSNLGSRYAPHPLCAGTWRLPALGAAIDRYLSARMESA